MPLRSKPAKLRGLGVALAVASSGIAATLLTGGRTSHNCFKIPIDMASKSPQDVCPIYENSYEEMLGRADIIIWDEVVMAPKANIEIVSRTKKICKNNRPFGGIVTVLGGDFKQILPVIKNQDKAAVVNATLHQSVHLWPEAQKLSLTEVVRAEQRPFANFLSQIGDGSRNEGAKKEWVALPPSLTHKKDGKPFAPADLVHCFPLLSSMSVTPAKVRAETPGDTSGAGRAAVQLAAR
eukprot:Rhum_TRINITY_DN15501_c0_g3::Rhum_TRINITY_DN15501_c0_g3_i3::g.160791::m.160791